MLVRNQTLIAIINGAIAALLFYAAMSKLMDYDKSLSEMRNQIFPVFVAYILTWLIPAIEIMLSLLLLLPSTRRIALWASLILLISFTVYIAVVMTGVFGRIPCSCGGVLKNMSYGTHLLFNLFFVALATLGVTLADTTSMFKRWFNIKKERSLPKN